MARLCSLIHEASCSAPGGPGLSIIAWILYWIWGCAVLSILESSSTLWRSTWAAFLRYHSITSQTYHPFLLTHPHVTYVKLSDRRTKAYVGSTSRRMLGREATRRRKFRQRGPCHAEPAIVWWKSTKSFFEFCPIVFGFGPTEDFVERLEFQTVHIRQPELNTPFVQKLLKRKRWELQPAQAKTSLKENNRWFKKARRDRLHRSWLQFVPQVWYNSDVEKVSATWCRII